MYIYTYIYTHTYLVASPNRPPCACALDLLGLRGSWAPFPGCPGAPISSPYEKLYALHLYMYTCVHIYMYTHVCVISIGNCQDLKNIDYPWTS